MDNFNTKYPFDSTDIFSFFLLFFVYLIWVNSPSLSSYAKVVMEALRFHGARRFCQWNKYILKENTLSNLSLSCKSKIEQPSSIWFSQNMKVIHIPNFHPAWPTNSGLLGTEVSMQLEAHKLGLDLLRKKKPFVCWFGGTFIFRSVLFLW